MLKMGVNINTIYFSVSDGSICPLHACGAPRIPYLGIVVGLLLALCPWLTGAGLLSELLQTSLQLQLLLAGMAELPRLLAVHRLQFAAKLALLGTQLP